MPAYYEQDIPCLVLEGTPYEMGYQRGERTGAALAESFAFYRSYLSAKLRHTRLGGSPRAVQLLERLERGYLLPLERGYLSEVREEMQGICDATGLAYEDIAPVLATPDWSLHLASAMFKGQLAAEHSRSALEALLSGLGCSSAAAWGGASQDGRLVMGRNLDYDSPRGASPLLVLYQPAGGQRFLSVTAAGLPTAGLTAMNESGIAVAIHIALSLDCSSAGRSIINICHDVARRARSLEEAVDIAFSHRAASGCTLLIASGPQRKAVAVEFSAKAARLRLPQGERIVQTNHYQTALREREAPYAAFLAHSRARYERAMQLLDSGPVGLEGMASLLGDRMDLLAGRERPLGNTICRPGTMSSSVLVPEELAVYVARRTSPDAPQSTGSYHRYTLEELASGRFSGGTIPGNDFPVRCAGREDALERFLGGYSAWLYDQDLAVRPIHDVARQDSEPLYAIASGMLGIARALRERGDVDAAARQALPVFEAALAASQGSPYLEAFGRFALGRAYLHLGARWEADVQRKALADISVRIPAVEYLQRRLRGGALRVREPEELLLEMFSHV